MSQLSVTYHARWPRFFRTRCTVMNIYVQQESQSALGTEVTSGSCSNLVTIATQTAAAAAADDAELSLIEASEALYNDQLYHGNGWTNNDLSGLTTAAVLVSRRTFTDKHGRRWLAQTVI